MKQMKIGYASSGSITISVFLALTLLAIPWTAMALDPNTKNPRQIAKAVEKRMTGDKMISRIELSYQDNSGQKRERILSTRSMRFKGGTKSLMIFESPADVRNTGFLSIDYDDGKKADDQWMYLPGYRKLTRISSAGRSESFMGTDITYADITTKDLQAYDFKLLKDSVDVDGEECWLIESQPRTNKEKVETGYIKIHNWISKSKLMILRSKIWVKDGKKLKYLQYDNIKKVNGIWIAHQVTIRTVKNGKRESETVMKTNAIRLNDPSVIDSDFTEHRLKKGI